MVAAGTTAPARVEGGDACVDGGEGSFLASLERLPNTTMAIVVATPSKPTSAMIT
jgi:hypothetical protein